MGRATTPKGEGNAVHVCVRVRPMHGKEFTEGSKNCVLLGQNGEVALQATDADTMFSLKGHSRRGFGFSSSHGPGSTSRTLYDNCVSELVQSVFQGYNATVLAYGQTGAGKTFTMVGGQDDTGRGDPGMLHWVSTHLGQMAAEHEAATGEEVEVTTSAVEIYQESLRDLCGPPDAKIRLCETRSGSTEVQGLIETRVRGREELTAALDRAAGERSQGSTRLNATSSRSHAVFTITVRRRTDVVATAGGGLAPAGQLVGKLSLVDLAGSERVKRTGSKGEQLKEASSINAGLLALGNVINALAERRSHIPYRQSKLTRLLQDSLGGNSLTALIACISPCDIDMEETHQTLKYASRASNISNSALQNVQWEEPPQPEMPPEGERGVTAGYEEILQQAMAERAAMRAAEAEAKGGAAARAAAGRAKAREYDRRRKEMVTSQGGNTDLDYQLEVVPPPPTSARRTPGPFLPTTSPAGGPAAGASGEWAAGGSAAWKGSALLPGRSISPDSPLPPPPSSGGGAGGKGRARGAAVHTTCRLEDLFGDDELEGEGAAAEEEHGAGVQGQVEGRQGEAGLPPEASPAAAAAPPACPLLRYRSSGGQVVAVWEVASEADHVAVEHLLGGWPAGGKNRECGMRYLLAREEEGAGAGGRAVGCLMASMGTDMIRSCLFRFPMPEAARGMAKEQGTELWGLQTPGGEGVPHRLDLSLALLLGYCRFAVREGIRFGFCVPRPKLLRRWAGAGVPIVPVEDRELICPPHAHDFEYYRSSVPACFLLEEMHDALESIVPTC